MNKQKILTYGTSKIGLLELNLDEYFDDGWFIKEIKQHSAGAGDGQGSYAVYQFLTILLERSV